MYNIYLHCGISAKKYYNPLHHKAKNKLSWYQEVLLYFCMLNILVFIWNILSSWCNMSSNDIYIAPKIIPLINKAMLNTSGESKSTHNTSLIKLDETLLLEYEQLKNTILPRYTTNNVVGFCNGDALEATLTTIKDTKLKSWYESFYTTQIIDILWWSLNPISAASSMKYIANINIDGISNKFTIGHIFNQFRHMVRLTNHKLTDELNINNNIVCMLCITYEKGAQLYDIIKEMKAKITQNGTIDDSEVNNYMQQIRDLKFIMNDMSYPII